MALAARRPLSLLLLAALAALAAGAFSTPQPVAAAVLQASKAAATRGQPAQHASQPRRATAQASRASVVRMQEEDFYAELGVGRSASEGEIKKAYRAAARKWHPDVNQEPGAKEKFQKINEAYQILSDPKMKQRYDQFGVAGVKGPGAGGPGGAYGAQDFDLGDIFESFFGGQQGGGPGGGRRRSGPTQGDDLRFDLEIDFNTALFGGSQKIRITHLETCGTCSGSGVAPGSKVTTCGTCGGRGVVVQSVNTILGRMQQQARCPTCGGTGSVVEKYCGSCDGKGVIKKAKQLTVTIPPGVEDGNRLRVRGEGDAGAKGGPPGDLYVFLTVKADPRFRREGMDVFSDVSISYIDAILGATLSVPTVDGSVDLKVPAGTQPGTTMRLEGKGAPKLNNVKLRGTHFVEVNVEIPRSLSNKERDLVQKLQAERS
jgi:molecular chaperone DnaJ